MRQGPWCLTVVGRVAPADGLPTACLQIWWLDPELTYGNAKPFVFTQGHSVCNRSFFPCFDTPAVKCTYSAVVKAPSGVQVLMSATQSTYVEEEGVYRFHMEHPVPAYLVALVAGDLQPADIGPR